jgi:hypothetical protein
MTKRWICGLVLLFCACAAGATAGEYRTVDVESLKIDFDSEWGTRVGPGYLPIRFDITNRGEARIIEIVGEGSRYFRGSRGGMRPGGVEIRQVVRLARGGRVRLTISVPVFGNNENIGFHIREGGRTLERFSYTGLESASPPALAAALIVAASGTGLSAQATSWLRLKMAAPGYGYPTGLTIGPGGGRSVPSSATPPPLDFVLEPARLPTNWLGYTSLRAVVIGPEEWRQLSEDQKTALLTWTACGGDLFFADGDLATLFPSGRAAAAVDDRAPRAHYFGRIHRPTSTQITATGLAAVLTAAEAVQDSNFALPANRASDWGKIAGRGFRLLIPGVNGVPARAYLFILVAFAFLIGPVNYWLLWRKRQQVLLVLTAPLVSAIFIMLLGAYVLAGEGLGVRARAVTFTMLDEARKHAVTRSSVSLYAAGMTPSGGLRFARDVAIYPIGADGTGSRDEQTLDLTNVQQFSDGVIQARTPTNFEQILFRPARERLSLSRESDGVSVVNGLGATITMLQYRDGATTYKLAAPLASGAKATLTAGTLDPRSVMPADVPLSDRFIHLLEHQPARSYLAVLERSPFWDPGVSPVSERASVHVMIGWPEGQP